MALHPPIVVCLAGCGSARGSRRLNTSTERIGEAMTARERWLAILAGRETDRIPVDLSATPEVLARLFRELDCRDERALWQRLHVDGRIEVAPRWKLPHYPDDPQADLWGVRYERMNYGTGVYEEPSHHPLAAAETVDDARSQLKNRKGTGIRLMMLIPRPPWAPSCEQCRGGEMEAIFTDDPVEQLQ